MIVHVKRISVFSAFKVGCFMSGVPLIALLLLGLVAALFGRVDPRLTAQLIVMGPLGVAAYIFVFGPLPGLLFALYALVYNLLSRVFGGFVIELDRRALKRVDLVQGAAPPNRVAGRLPIDNAMPSPSNGGSKTDVHDEVAILKRQIAERQQRIQDVNMGIHKRT